MNRAARPLAGWTATHGGRKAMRYLLVSVMNLVLGEAVLGFAFYFLHWSVQVTAVVAVMVTTVPAYFLNRTWVWGQSGRSHLWKEVLPFWALAIAYLVLSVGAARAAERIATGLTGSRLLRTAFLMGAILIASGVLWLLRFVVLDNLVFPGRKGLDRFAAKAADAPG